ncbi:hypothetical protein GJU40_18160 [Bacillus lacus]|uniref:B3/B4 tRNA-binding domain-containing protein n=1 Tax=Metabacillus lacus TaxID=1983721 RepID=A0A7X2J278_9BACI|nr:phenylalanine--tRNA ligase beta subunit-related protein [Metabacillus lacus]MRX74050.1 hypothetical protein [Metabacillus lacus]
MKIIIEESIKKIIPGFKLAAVTYNDITISDSPAMLRGRLQLFQESLYFQSEEKKPADYDGIREWRSIFKALGADPNRYRPSQEAMYRRIAKQQFLSPIHSAADMNNFFSLQYTIPFGIYDCDKLEGDIILSSGSENDTYEALNGRTVSLKNIPVLSDSIGPFGSPYVDSKRSAVSLETVKCLQIAFLNPNQDPEDAKSMAESFSKMFSKIHGGSAAVYVL